MKATVRAIITQEGMALIDPFVSLLEQVLTTPAFKFEQGGTSGHRRVEEEVCFFDIDHKNRMMVPVGLLSRCIAALNENGHHVEVEDLRRFGRRHRADKAVVAEAEGEDQRFLEAIAREKMGPVVVRGFHDSLRRIVQLRRLLPEARIAVGVATRRELWKFWHALEQNLKEKVGLLDADNQRHGRMVVVSTHQQLTVADDADVLVVTDAMRAVGDAAVTQIVGAGVRRVYGFVTTGGVGPRNALAVEGLCGPVIFRPGDEVAKVRVVTVKTPTRKTTTGLVGLERKRQAYWKNSSRNKLVARAVRALLKSDVKELSLLGLADGQSSKTGFENGRVTVLVESTEHGKELLKLLPEATLIDATPNKAGKEAKEAEVEDHSGPLIVTALVAARDGIDADVIVRVTGGSSPLNVKDFPPTAEEQTQEVLLVDLDDGFDAEAKRDTTQRIGDYQTRNFVTG